MQYSSFSVLVVMCADKREIFILYFITLFLSYDVLNSSPGKTWCKLDIPSS